MTEPKPFRERLSWEAVPGEIRDGEIRYILVRPDALMAIFAGLDPPARDAALAAFQDSVATFGGQSAAKYAATAERPLIDVVAATAPQLGWGCWTVEPTSDGYRILVENSPFAAGFGAADRLVCTPIVGMLTAVGRIMGGGGAEVRETSCAAEAGGHTCRFEIGIGASQ
ncbi:4-vinyl reductase [Caulobacter sp. S45]|uniref:4-vinyl reductase n=1 Tax=Caulobacter sp. S45 TaxID=1641861 RepID=UPI00131AD6C0|nr:4-vinyl reductase [Caulobacter sp. S45]